MRAGGAGGDYKGRSMLHPYRIFPKNQVSVLGHQHWAGLRPAPAFDLKIVEDGTGRLAAFIDGVPAAERVQDQ